MVSVNVYRTFCEIWTCIFVEICQWTDLQTSSSQYFAPLLGLL